VARLLSEAIFLRSVDFGESDRIVHLLTAESGRLTAIAKGARRSAKRFPGTLDLFNHLRVQVERPRRSGLARLEQARLLCPFLELRNQTGRFALGCYLMELIDRLAPEGGSPAEMRRLFQFSLSTLRALCRTTAGPGLRILLELRALDALGLRPELRFCVRCSAEVCGPGRVGFHVADGGAVCGACAAEIEGLLPVHLGTLRALEQGLDLDSDRLDRLGLGPSALLEARKLVGRFKRFHVGVELRSERFLEEILHPGATPGAP
jgi:DNA repair protein RecO (recombination protein O)